MNEWILLVVSLPTENATLRMRAWRSLKAVGVVVLRDGVYLLPQRPECVALFESTREDVRAAGGTAMVLRVLGESDDVYERLFDRSEDYAHLLEEVNRLQARFAFEPPANLVKQFRKLRKALSLIVSTDYFPGPALAQTEAALAAAEAQLNRLVSPDEPLAVAGDIERLDMAKYRGRNWATRKRPWVDRLASAWLIRRFIDNSARFIWLETPAQCPVDALGFDFDGATFTHVGVKVTFEVLLASFGLDLPGLLRLGGIVHYLDVGGIQPSEASGLEQILWGLRNTLTDDDQLLTAACGVFDALFTAFTEKAQ